MNSVKRVALLAVLGSSAVAQFQRRNAQLSSPLTQNNFTSYAPVEVTCPAVQQWVRPAEEGLSPEEAAWVAGRKQKVASNFAAYLQRLNLQDFDVSQYIDSIQSDPSNAPTIGMAISGGGWGSALTGTGALRAFDDQFPPAVAERTGGILQSLTYISGLSGGSWPGMSYTTHNAPSVQEMVTSWHVDLPSEVTTNMTYRGTPEQLFEQIVPKFQAGFNVSMMDFLGRSFAYEFVAGPEGGLNTMVSDIALLNNFLDYNMPLPLWQAAATTPNDAEFYGLVAPSYNATLYEWSPFEFGAWKGPSAFFPTKYLGTKVTDGQPDDECIVGFDRASFMLGLAADAPNFWIIQHLSNGTLGSFSKRSVNAPSHELVKRVTPPEDIFPWPVVKELAGLFEKYFNYTLEECVYASLPNPFASSTEDEYNHPTNLTLLDGSEMGQSLPLWTQIQPARQPEFIVAWDNDGDALPYGWNNGTNMYNTYTYATDLGIPFPIIPPPTTFINRNFTFTPTFFGCDASLTNTGDESAPIILYLANAPYSAYTNFTWFQTNYTDEQMAVILTNGFNFVTQGNSTLDPEWPECIGCAAIDRSLGRLGMERSQQCQACMERYCWDGVEDNSETGFVDLALVLDPTVSFAQWNKTSSVTFWAEYGG